MEEKVINRFNEIFGFNISEKTKRRKVTRARQAVARLFLYNGYSLTGVAKILGVSRQEVAAGNDRFSRYWQAKDTLTEECWEKIKDEEV